MQGLGISTTRALFILGSEEAVYRERIKSGAMLLRMAFSHVRFGTFESFYYSQQYEQVVCLADYVIDPLYPWLNDNIEKIQGF